MTSQSIFPVGSIAYENEQRDKPNTAEETQNTESFFPKTSMAYESDVKEGNISPAVGAGHRAPRVRTPQLNPNNMYWPPYDFTAPEGEKDLTDKLRAALARNHVQVHIMSFWDCMIYIVNNWNQKDSEGKRLGETVLKDVNTIKGYLDKGLEVTNSIILVKTLGGLGIVAKETTTKNGYPAIVISSVWNDSKMHYATINGMNIKKNHPYRMDNPKIKQLGFAHQAKMAGAVKAGALTLIVSAALATEKLINDDAYNMVDWYGTMGTELIKIGVTSVLTILFVSSSAPIIVGVAIAVGLAIAVDAVFQAFKVEESITQELKSATAA